MSIVCQASSCPSPQPDHDPSILAVHMLESGYDRTSNYSARGFNHVLVAVDKFTKWIEYKPIVKISTDRAVDFIYDIVH